MDRVGDGGYRDLIAWQKAMVLVRSVYELTKTWPQYEQFGLTNQERRAAVSVPSNIAEGKGRTGSREYSHHLSVSHGSLCELETQLLIAQDLGYATDSQIGSVMRQTADVGRLIRGLIKSLA
jgi:four helix bundle protein